MKLSKIIITTAVILNLFSAAAFAAPQSPNSSDNTLQHKSDTIKRNKSGSEKFVDKNSDMKNCKDPLEILQKKREKVQRLLEEGKISKEKADIITKRIDSRIEEVKEFEKLTPEQKKEKLINRFKESVDRKVKEGKLTEEKAEELYKRFKEKVEKWDGKGYPRFKCKDHCKREKN